MIEEPEQILPKTKEQEFRDLESTLMSYSIDAPVIDTYFDDQKMKNLAKTLNEIIKSTSKSVLTEEEVKTFQKGIRRYIYEVAVTEARYTANRREGLNNSQVQFNEAQIQMADLKKENQRLRDSMSFQKDLEEENDELEQVNQSLMNQIDTNRKVYENKIRTERQQYEILNDKHSEALSQLSIKESIIQRLNLERDEINSNLETLREKHNETDKQNMQYHDQIVALKDENRKLKMQLIDNQNEIEVLKLNKSLDTNSSMQGTNNDKLLAENQRLNKTICELNSIMEEQSSELVKNNEEISQLSTDLEKSYNICDELEIKIKSLNEKKDKLKKTLKETEENFQNNLLQYDELKRRHNDLEEKHKETNKSLEEVISVSKSLGKKDSESFLEFIKRVSKGSLDADIVSQNIRLGALADSLAVFINRLAKGEKSDINFHVKPLLDDETNIERLELAINNIRKELHTEEFDKTFNNELSVHETIESIFKSGSADAFAAISALSSIITIASKEGKDLRNLFNKCKPLLRDDIESSEIPKTVIDLFCTIIPRLEDLVFVIENVCQFQSDSDASIDFISDYVRSSAKVISSVKSELRSRNGYDVDVRELPFSFAETLSEYERTAKTAAADADRALNTAESLSRQLDASERRNLSGSLSEESIDHVLISEQVRDQLNESMKVKERQISDLIAKNELLKAERTQQAEAIDNIKETTKDLELKTFHYQKEILRLNALLRDREEAFKRRIKEAVAAEHEISQSEAAVARKRLEDKTGILEEELARKTRKYTALKRSSGEQIAALEKTVGEQSAANKELAEENERLNNIIEEAGDVGKLKEQISELQAKLRQSNIARHAAILQASSSPRKSPRKSPSRPSSDEIELIEGAGAAFERGGVERPKDGWTADRIIVQIQRQCERTKELSSDPSVVPRTQRLSHEVSAWNEWATSLLKKRGIDVPTGSDALMATISDISNTPASAVRIIRSLREQKKIIESNLPINEKREEPIGLRSLAAAFVFMATMKTKRSISLARSVVNELEK